MLGGGRDRPRLASVLALSRQGLPPQRTDYADNPCLAGGYVLTPESAGPRQVTLVASGSEVAGQ